VPATIDGVEAAQAAYQGLADDARNLGDVFRDIAQAGEDAARARAPVGATGRLGGSIKGSSSSSEATLAVGVSYWPYQEFGTKYLKARRYMAAGMRAAKRAAGDGFRKHLDASWKKRAKNARAAAKSRKADG
jgi:hypothetical protein